MEKIFDNSVYFYYFNFIATNYFTNRKAKDDRSNARELTVFLSSFSFKRRDWVFYL